jgi:hypothetical protein
MYSKQKILSWEWWLRSISLATHEVKIRRIKVQGQPGKNTQDSI